VGLVRQLDGGRLAVLFQTPKAELRLGVQTPVVIQTPGGHARWEESAGPDELRRVVVAADALGYSHLTCSEHFAIPPGQRKWRGVVYWDPAATLSWMAALTSRILLATNVVVLGYHHPLELLKTYGTLDRLSGGRLVLGVGVGTLRQEFDLLGSPFGDRGRRADESLAAIRDGWGKEGVDFEGEYFAYRELSIEPHSPREQPTIWVGGRTERSLLRAIEFGQGWTPFGLSNEEIAHMLAGAHLPESFDVVLASGPLDPKGSPEATVQSLEALAGAGATALHCGFVHHSLDDYLEQLEALAELVLTG
jgi:probable F420-dependent oxidoreductase